MGRLMLIRAPAAALYVGLLPESGFFGAHIAPLQKSAAMDREQFSARILFLSPERKRWTSPTWM